MSEENEKPLCLQPMTASDARYDEGRKAGLLEAARLVDAELEALRDPASEWRRAMMVLALRLRKKAGEP